jgi:carbonic anhydrase
MADHQAHSPDRRVSRRRALGVGAGIAMAGLSGPAGRAHASDPQEASLDPDQAWRRLLAGNERFVSGRQRHPRQQIEWRARIAEQQHPFACVLGCADSRVAPELVFDHGLGELFVVRTAGQVLDESITGSIEYAVALPPPSRSGSKTRTGS